MLRFCLARRKCFTPLWQSRQLIGNKSLSPIIKRYSIALEDTTSETFDPYFDGGYDFSANATVRGRNVDVDEILEQSKRLHATHVLRNVAESYLQLPEMQPSIGESLMEIERTSKMLSQAQVIQIYQHLLLDHAGADKLSTENLIHVGRVSTTETSQDIDVMEKIFSTLLGRWKEQEERGPGTHFKGTWIIFCLLRAISRLDFERGSWRFRDLLLARSYWPPGTTEVSQQVNDPSITMSLFMLRCCVSWRWWERSIALANDIMTSSNVDRPSAKALAAIFTSLAHEYMDANTHDFNPRLPASLICAMADHPHFSPVEDALIQRFYKECVTATPPHPELVSKVYLRLRDKALVSQSSKSHSNATIYHVKAPHAYLPPRGLTLITLLSHYYKTNNQNAARVLVADTKSKLHSLSASLLSSYLECVIHLSFSTEAREIYTLCRAADDIDKRRLTRHPGIVRQLVSLFTSMANASYNRSLAHRSPVRRAHYTLKAEELSQFAREVVVHYRKRGLKLSKWSHPELTTLARITFEAGYYRDGITALECVAKREDFIPEPHDIHVVLNAVASADPQGALEILQYMIKLDIEPREEMYGVVAAHGMKLGQLGLAEEIMKMARRRGRSGMQSRLLGAICWHSVSTDAISNIEKADIVHRLLLVLNMLKEASREGWTVFRERTLGVRSAQVALAVNRPDLALRFWKRCIQYKSIVRQPDEAAVRLHQDPEKRLRFRILKSLEKMQKGKAVSTTLRETLAEAPAAESVKLKRDHVER